MEHRYCFAGISITVRSTEDVLYTEHGVLSPFLSDHCSEDCRVLNFSLVNELSPEEGELIYADGSKRIYRTEDSVIRFAGSYDQLRMRIRRQGRMSDIQCLQSAYPAGVTPKTVLNAMEAEHLVVQNYGLILHASFVRTGDRAILFTAPSGTGKSTQAELWCHHRDAELINGDRAAVMLENNAVYACGIPFSGSSGVGKAAKLPLGAIIYLSQSPENHVERLSGFRAFRKVWEGCSVNIWNREDLSLSTDTLMQIIDRVPIYHLSCRPDENAVETMEAVLSKTGVL